MGQTPRAPQLDPVVADDVPWSDDITSYDDEHLVTYMRLLDADAEGADWREVARIVLHRDPETETETETERTRCCWEVHLARARWMTSKGYRKLLEQAALETRVSDEQTRS